MSADLRARLAAAVAVPVITAGPVADTVELCRALVAGGLDMLEITLRTETALPALDAVARALDGVPREEKVARQQLCCSVPYPLEGLLRRLLPQHGAELLQVAHDDAVTLQFALPASQVPALRTVLAEACHGQLRWQND